jgi:hypothetical protein
MHLRIVDLPEPLAPMMTATSPASTSNDTPLSTSSAPKLLTTFCTWIMGVMGETQ